MTTWMWRAAFAALFGLAATDADAQTVQKCITRDGSTRYQSEPCPRGERTAEVWDATPDPVAPASDEPRPRKRSTRTRSATSRRTARTAVAAVDTHNTCADARAYRDAVERRAGLARNYALLSTLQDRVYDACR
ncbi:hypothetical protein [Cognatilysobacter terrigena]|uniref:hypothetical protein n=1 Tax=Cognatilysobacter terrigena TaxID=2488749 RepID=UPI00105B3C46|nr:hypothetical protein [Lysobacter terrigena]